MASQWSAMPFRRVTIGVVAALLVLLTVNRASAQVSAGAPTYRVFLKDGPPLASYGDTARVGDRVIFNLPMIGADGQITLQLISLDAAVVDLERTDRYAETMRAAYYASTRGERDYLEMTEALTAELGRLSTVTDAAQQLAAAERLRAELLSWSSSHFYYRAGDIDRFVGLFGDIISQLRAATGSGGFALDLSAGHSAPAREPVLPAPAPSESIALALVAARAADISEERIAVLRAALGVAADPTLRREAGAELERELRIEQQYAALARDFRSRAAEAVKRGSVLGVERLRSELLVKDRTLGGRRPQTIRSLTGELDDALERTRAYRSARDRYNTMLRALLAYERRVRPALSAFDAFTPLLERVRDAGGAAFEPTVNAEARLRQLQFDAGGIVPPDDVAGVHATLVSALQMAVEACARYRQAAATTRAPIASQASSAAAAALLLANRARTDLLSALYPPKVR